MVKLASTQTVEFQHTEIGQIPSDWKLEFVEDFCKISTGGRNTQDRVADGAYPFFVRSQKIENIDSYSYDEEAILTAGDGVGTGKVFHYVDGKYDAHQRVYRMFDFKHEVSAKYFFRYFSEHFYARIMQMTAKSSVDSVRRDMISRMLIALPRERSEQDAIAEALNDADSLIESLAQLIAKKRAIKHGAMQELLTGKRRLAGYALPWSKRRIGDLLTIKHGKSQHEIEDQNGTYPILATGGQIGLTNKFLWNKPSVLIGRKGTIDRPQYVDTPFWTVDTLFYSAILDENCAKFLFYRFCLIDWRIHNEASGVPSLNAKTIENIEIDVPKPDEQRAIGRLISDIDFDIDELKIKLKKAQKIKQGMMQELLTGRTRLV